MQSIRSISPMLRAIGVIAAVAVLVTSITLAVGLSDSVTLTENNLATASADLEIWDDEIPAWADTAKGFSVTDIVPGDWSGPHNFYLRNVGGVALDVSAQVLTSPLPALTNITDHTYVKVKIVGEGCADPALVTNLQALSDNPLDIPCNPLLVGEAGSVGATDPGNYTIEFQIDPAGITPGSSYAEVANFAITFDGTQTIPTPTPAP